MSHKLPKEVKHSTNELEQKKSYSSPQVTIYGDLRELTKGGSKNSDEAGGNNGSRHTHIT
jgi:hypothetical protein